MWLAWPLTPLPSKVSTWNNKISHCVGVKPESGYLKVNSNKRRQRQRERFFLVWWTGFCVWLWSCLAADNWYLKTFFCLHACTPEEASEKKKIRSKGKKKCLTKDLAFAVLRRILPWLGLCNQHKWTISSFGGLFMEKPGTVKLSVFYSLGLHKWLSVSINLPIIYMNNCLVYNILNLEKKMLITFSRAQKDIVKLLL